MFSREEGIEEGIAVNEVEIYKKWEGELVNVIRPSAFVNWHLLNVGSYPSHRDWETGVLSLGFGCNNKVFWQP